MARQSKVREQRETEMYEAFREGMTYALDKFIIKELGGKWTASLHMARLEELLRVVYEDTFTTARKMRMLAQRRESIRIAEYEAHLTEKAGA